MKKNPPPTDIRLVIFDLDGTLVDAYPAIADSVNFMLRKMGKPQVSLRKVTRSVGWGVDTLMKGFVPPDEVKKALRIFREHHDIRLKQKVRVLPGTRALLALLKKKGVRLAVASNRPTRFCRQILKRVGIDGYFDSVICGDKVKRAKPYPDMALAILKKARVKASQAVFVGDMSVDMISARRAKVFSIAVSTGSCTLKELKAERPGLLLRKLDDFRKVVPLTT